MKSNLLLTRKLTMAFQEENIPHELSKILLKNLLFSSTKFLQESNENFSLFNTNFCLGMEFALDFRQNNICFKKKINQKNKKN